MKTAKKNESVVSIRTITSKDNRFIVGIKTISKTPPTAQLILLTPPGIPSVLNSLAPEELLALRDFVGEVAAALEQQNVKIVKASK